MMIPRLAKPISRLALLRAARAASTAPAGQSDPPALRRVTLPGRLAPGVRLFAVGDDGTTRDVTDDVEGDLGVLVALDEGLLAADAQGIVRWRQMPAVRPSGAVGDPIRLEIVNASELGIAGGSIRQGSQDITNAPTPDGVAARWGDPGAGFPLSSWFVGAVEIDEPIAVKIGMDPTRVFSLGAVRGNEARLDLNQRVVRLRNFPTDGAARLVDGTLINAGTLPNGAAGAREGDDWVLGVPAATQDVMLYTGGRRRRIALAPIAEGERELIVDASPIEASPDAPGPIEMPDRITLRLSGWQNGFSVSAPGVGDLTGSPPPGRDSPWLSDMRGQPDPLAGGQTGTWNIGAPSSVRAIVVRYGPRTVQSFRVPAANANGAAAVDVATPSFAALRLRNLPPHSRVFDGATDVTTQSPIGGPGGWDGRDWIIGLRSDAGQLVVVYPSGRRATIQVPRTMVRGERVASVPADPGATPSIPSMVTLRLRNLPRGADGQPAASIVIGGSAATFSSRPGGVSAAWEGSDWLLGMRGEDRAASVRYASGATRDLTWPAPTAGQTEVIVDAAPPAGAVATSRTTLHLENLPAGSRMYVGAMDVSTDSTTDGTSSGWLGRVGGTYAIGIPTGTTEVRVVYPADAGVASRTISLPAPVGNVITVNAAPQTVSASMVNLRIVNIAEDTLILVGEQDATTWSRADGARASYDAATRTRTIGIPTSVRAARLREANGTVRTLDVLPPPVAGIITVTLPPPVAPPTRRNVRLVGFPPSSRVYVDGLDVTTDAPTGGHPGGWVNREDWELSVPSTARSVTVRYPSGNSRTLALGSPGADGFVEVTVPVDAAALGDGAQGPDGLLPDGARRINIVFTNLPAGARVMYGGADIARAPQVNGSPATRREVPGPITGLGVVPATETVFGFALDPNITQEIAVLPPESAPGAWSQIQYPINAREVRGDVLRLQWSGVPGVTTNTSTNPLAGTRVWMIDPPVGTYAVAHIGRSGDVRLSGPTTQLSRAAAMGDPPATSDTDVTQGARLPPAPVWVTEATLPADVASSATVEVVLPNGARLPVSLSPVPSDGIFRVDLSAYPGARPTQSSAGDHVAVPSAQASASGGGGALLLGLAAVAGGGLWLFGRKGQGARPNPARASTHSPRSAR